MLAPVPEEGKAADTEENKSHFALLIPFFFGFGLTLKVLTSVAGPTFGHINLDFERFFSLMVSMFEVIWALLRSETRTRL